MNWEGSQEKWTFITQRWGSKILRHAKIEAELKGEKSLKKVIFRMTT